MNTILFSDERSKGYVWGQPESLILFCVYSLSRGQSKYVVPEFVMQSRASRPEFAFKLPRPNRAGYQNPPAKKQPANVFSTPHEGGYVRAMGSLAGS